MLGSRMVQQLPSTEKMFVCRVVVIVVDNDDDNNDDDYN